MNKEITLTLDECRALWKELQFAYISPENVLVHNLLNRIASFVKDNELVK
jgi:hypothetical protein